MGLLYIIRGLPGSGKSTIAKSLNFKHHYEADMFFIKNGEYKFDPSKLREAHRWCQRQVENALKKGENVVVSNTFTTRKEVQPYIDLANKYNVQYRIVEATGNYKNVHGVPDDALQRMRNRWEKI